MPEETAGGPAGAGSLFNSWMSSDFSEETIAVTITMTTSDSEISVGEAPTLRVLGSSISSSMCFVQKELMYEDPATALETHCATLFVNFCKENASVAVATFMT